MKEKQTFLSQLSKRNLLSLLAILALFQACKENTILPSDLVPAIDNINTFSTDTFTLITNNVYQDSILTGGIRNTSRISNSATSFHALGTIIGDPSFGKTNANIHVEVLPPVANFSFKTDAPGTTRTIDSVVLILPYVGAYGDTLTAPMQTFKVFRSLKTASRDSAQYEFTKDSTDNNLLSSLSVNFNTLSTDSPIVNGIKLVPQLRFKLNNWFADSLQAQIALGTNGAGADFSKYLEWWKGFYIQADSNVGRTLGYFNTYGARMNIYYRYTNTSLLPDTALDVFSFDPNYCNRFNNINRNYFGSSAHYFYNSTAPNGDSILFLQNEPGLAGLIKMPYLTQFENVIVNRAELHFYAVSLNNFTDTNTFHTIPRLQILQTDTVGNDKIIADYSLLGTTFVDGKQKSVTVGGFTLTEYKFGVTYSIQKIISEKDTNFRFKIMGLNTGFPAAYRTTVAGSDSKVDYLRPKLNIIYTKIKK